MKKKSSDATSSSKKKQSKVNKETGNELNEENKSSANPEKNKEKEEFPGYPHYPVQDDIMNPANDVKKASLDIEDITPSAKPERVKSPKKNIASTNDPVDQPIPSDLKDEDEEIAAETETDVTKEDLELLGSDELNTDMGDDEDLKQRVYPVDMAAEDLDVPGTEDDDDDEEIGEEDEENNPYSIGGDRHEDLEEEGDPGR